MSNEKFTPGPWKAKGRTIYPENQSDPSNTEIVCRIHENRFASREEANAALISAAPEMYAELADLLEAMERGLFPQVAPGVDYPAVMEKKHELRKLLAKARGEK